MVIVGHETKGAVMEWIRNYLFARNFTPSLGSVSTYDTVVWNGTALAPRRSGIEVVFNATALTNTNIGAALTELMGSAIRRRQLDLATFNEWRLACTTGVAANAGAVMGMQYSLDSGSNWSGLDNGTAATISTATVDLNATAGPLVSSWASINAAAKTSSTFLRVVTEGGDGAADPQYTIIVLELR